MLALILTILFVKFRVEGIRVRIRFINYAAQSMLDGCLIRGMVYVGWMSDMRYSLRLIVLL